LDICRELEATPVVFSTAFTESVWVSIALNKDGNLLVGCIYRSPNSSEENNRNLSLLLKEANSKHYSRVFPNIDWDLEQPIGSDKDTAKFLESVKGNFMFQHVTEPTRGRVGQTSNLLDLVMSNVEDMVQELTMEAPLGMSDHSVLTFKACCSKEIILSKTVKYQYDKGDYDSMNDEISKIDWNNELCNKRKDDVESQWQFFTMIL